VLNYFELLPDRPYCTDRLGALLIRKRETAVQFPIIQHNRSTLKHWMVFDLDCEDAFFRHEDRGLPPPNFCSINRQNGHAHIGYKLEIPVSFYETSHREPIRFLDAVDRGFTKRLGADEGYSGFLSKNPLNKKWESVWHTHIPYTLGRLNDYLDKKDKQRAPKPENSVIGRNVTIFDHIRKISYREVLKFKKSGKSEEDFCDMLEDAAQDKNSEFYPYLLGISEIRSLARSVSGWTWNEFTLEDFSAIQAARGRRRWSKVQTLTATKPWEAEGICRRTWERRRSRQTAALI
jgi:hypothetical protein